MSCQLPADCLNDIFEYLRDDEEEDTLRSCLLVNRLWCEVSVPILWTNIQSYNTLITCLPIESKEILFKNGIIISTLTSKPPLFNYVTFIKILKIYEIVETIKTIYKHTVSQSTDTNKEIVMIQEIFKMFMNQISLKRLDFYSSYSRKSYVNNISFFTYPGAIDCLKNLSMFNCSSDVHYEFFHQLSQTCHHLQSLKITIRKVISNGLTKLISVQQNLKYLKISNELHDNYEVMEVIFPSLTKLPNTLIKINLFFDVDYHIPLSFLAKFTNLQEIVLSLGWFDDEYFKILHHVTFPRLQILKFLDGYPNHEHLTKFFENNGENLKELHISRGNGNNRNSLNLAIAKFCLNLKSLYTTILYNEIETFKEILSSCQQLESIEILCGKDYLNIGELLNVVARYSSKEFYELRIRPIDKYELFPEALESGFTSWANRIPQKPLSFIIIETCYMGKLVIKKESMEAIEKFKELGVIKKFETVWRLKGIM